MPTLLKIGHDYYLVKEAAAVKAVSALAGAVKLRRNFRDAEGDTFYIEKHQDEIGMLTVRPNAILERNPETGEERSVFYQPAPRKPKQLSAPLI